MAELSELIAKLEGLSGPSREVDAEIARTFSGMKVIRGPDIGNYLYELQPGSYQCVEAFTRSIDAAVALVERKLPGAYRASGKTAAYPGMIPGSPTEKFFARVGSWGEPVRSYHDHEPVAIVLALLRALSSEQGNE